MNGTEHWGASRARVLQVLQDASEPLGVTEVAEAVGLHPNTVRFHLDALVETGSVERSTQARTGPGRRRVIYSARPDIGPAGQRDYQFLAEILAGQLASTSADPAKDARAAGAAWGRYLADRPAPYQHVGQAESINQLIAMLRKVGFAPRMTEDEQSIDLLQCPFREVAKTHGAIVCSIHLGLMQGLLSEIDSDVEVPRLDPFVAPGRCVAHLRAS